MNERMTPEKLYDYLTEPDVVEVETFDYLEEQVSLYPETLHYGGLEAGEHTVALGGLFRLRDVYFSGDNAITRASHMKPESIDGDDSALAA